MTDNTAEEHFDIPTNIQSENPAHRTRRATEQKYLHILF